MSAPAHPLSLLEAFGRRWERAARCVLLAAAGYARPASGSGRLGGGAEQELLCCLRHPPVQACC